MLSNGVQQALAVRTHMFEDLAIGMAAKMARVVTDADVVQFANLSGDHNPVHLDEAYAAGTLFQGRIAHGILTASYISAVLGTKLPGPGAIYISQTLNFRAPVRIGDEVVTQVKIRDLLPHKHRVMLDCACVVGETVVLEGEAVLKVPSRG